MEIDEDARAEANKLIEDWIGLQHAFRIGAGRISPEMLRVFAVHHEPRVLENLGLIKPDNRPGEPKAYVPAGHLAEELDWHG